MFLFKMKSVVRCLCLGCHLKQAVVVRGGVCVCISFELK